MKRISIAVSVVMLLSSGGVWAADQHNKMRGCNVEAKVQSLSGDARKDFMKKCLKSDYKLKPETVEKMKSCGEKAKTKKMSADEEKKFMSSCLHKPA